MNVLLTSVGRRSYVVKYFKQALGSDGQVHVCNSDDLSVAFQYADKSVISPIIYSDEYVPFLIQYCKDNNVDMLLSLFDIDLYILAKHKNEFAKIGTTVIVSDAEFIEICNDKWKTYLFLKENGFNVPKTYLYLDDVIKDIKTGKLNYPIVVKPRFGCGSIANSVANDEGSLSFYYNKNAKTVENTYLKYESALFKEKIVFQEYLQGQEYGVDVINDLDGRHRNAIIKKKMAMRAGETDIAETVDEPIIMKVATELGNLSGHVGNLDCDIFLVNGIPYLLELNARFGGGYPFSHIAGCDLPSALVKWRKGENVGDDLLQAKCGVRAFKELVITEDKG